MSEWQPIETAPKDTVCLFIVRPGRIDEDPWYDTSGNPILVEGKRRVMMGKRGMWSSLEKADWWFPIPPLPPESGPLKGEKS